MLQFLNQAIATSDESEEGECDSPDDKWRLEENKWRLEEGECELPPEDKRICELADQVEDSDLEDGEPPPEEVIA